MFCDPTRAKQFDEMRQTDLRLFQNLLTPEVFFEAAQQAGLRVLMLRVFCSLIWFGDLKRWRTSAH